MSALAAVAAGLALKAAVILGFGLAVASLLKRASATSRHFLWSGILLGALALPLLSAVLPVWEPIEWPGRVTFERTAPLPDPPAPAPSAATVDALPVAPVPRPAPGPPPRAKAPAPTGAWSWSWVGPIAAGGAGLFLMLLGRSVGRLRRIVRTGRPLAANDRRRTRLDGHARALGLPSPPRLVESNAATVPFVWGVFRPVVVLPPASAGWSDARLDAVLLHECAHVRHHDVPVRIASEMVCALHWFNPLAWMAARRLRAVGEAACDDAVLAAGVRPADYAGELLGLSVEQRWHLRAAGAMAGTSPIGRRIEQILDPDRPRDGSARTRRLTGAGLLALVLPVAAFAPSGQEPVAAFPPGADAVATDGPGSGAPAVQFRFQTDAAAGVVFTQGTVDVGAAARPGSAADARGSADEGPGFLLAVRRDGNGPLRTAWTVAGAAAPGRVRDETGDRAWPTREPAWLESTLRLTAQRLGGLTGTIRRDGASLDAGGTRLRASGSVMTGLPATTEDSGRGTLAAGWRQAGARAGLFACGGASDGPDADAARNLLRRVARSGSLDSLGTNACLVVYTWEPGTSRLRVIEAWRTGDGPLRVRAADGDAPLSRVEAERWLAEILPVALETLR